MRLHRNRIGLLNAKALILYYKNTRIHSAHENYYHYFLYYLVEC